MQAFDVKRRTGQAPGRDRGQGRDQPDVPDRRPALRTLEAENQAAHDQKGFDVEVAYDRTKLTTNDLLQAKATLKYNGDLPTNMVMLDLGIPPGFTVEPGDFAEMVGKKQVNKFSITSRQVILYLGDLRPGDVKTFDLHAAGQVSPQSPHPRHHGLRILHPRQPRPGRAGGTGGRVGSVTRNTV